MLLNPFNTSLNLSIYADLVDDLFACKPSNLFLVKYGKIIGITQIKQITGKNLGCIYIIPASENNKFKSW